MTETLFKDFYRIEVPLPGSPLGWVNSYVIKGPDRNLVIDTGLHRKECLDALKTGLARIDVNPKQTDFYITHLHADHFALVPSISSDTSDVFINRPDWEFFSGKMGLENTIDYALQNGFPEDELKVAVGNHPGIKYGPDKMPEMIPVDEGDKFEYGDYRFTAVATPGHTRGHTCLYEPDRKILVSGDHILLDITPNITTWEEERDPLDEYLASLDKLLSFPVKHVLPGHRRIFSDCPGRISELKQHHDNRLNEILSILETGPRNAYQTASRMSWDIDCKTWESFPPAQKYFATGEAMAHLKYLESQGRIFKTKKTDTYLFFVNDKKVFT